MIRRLDRVVCVVAAMALSSSKTIEAGAQGSVNSYGIGLRSCATWTSNRATDAEVYGWILGFWTGMNEANTSNHLVGLGTDGFAILAEARRACTLNPTDTIANIVEGFYVQLMKIGR